MNIKNVTLIATTMLASAVVHAGQTTEQRELSKILTQTASAVNAQVPMTLEAHTRLDSVATVRNMIVYNNTLTQLKAEQLDPAKAETALKSSVIDQLCSNPGLKSFINLKVVMVYRYVDKDGQFVAELSKDLRTG